ncbi:MAG: hypothetical protein ACI8QT_000543 [Halioglobus sp.]|jgi:hypothetical protein
MQKIIFPLWKHLSQASDDFRDTLIESLPGVMMQCSCVTSLRITVADSDVASAAPKRLECCQPLPDAVISIYLDGSVSKSSDDLELFELALRACTHGYTRYGVSESQPLKNVAHIAASGQRTYGFCQVVFLQRPERLTKAQWLELWQVQHTQVAIDTQATFAYRQNVIETIVSPDAPLLHAMIEENFPPQAMTSDQAFYGVNNQAQLDENMAAMMQSCAQFIDFDRIDVIPMSEYSFQP